MATNTPNERRTPHLSDTAKNILRNQRRQLAREQADNVSRQAIAARTFLDRTYKPIPLVNPQKVRTPDQSLATALQRTLVPRTAAVLASEGIVATIRGQFGPHVERSAYTDFHSIVVEWPVHADDDVAELSATLRGAFYHEGGHIRFTTPLAVLFAEYQVKAPFGPKRTTAEQMWNEQKGMLHYAWNLSEDQRMEALVVEDSPRKASFLAPMVIEHVLDWRNRTSATEAEATWNKQLAEMVSLGILTPEQAKAMPFNTKAHEQLQVAAYPLAAWRTYMPKSLRKMLRGEFAAFHGIDKTRRIEGLILTYMRSTNPVVQIDALVELAPLLKEAMVPPPDGNGGSASNDHGGMDRTWGFQKGKGQGKSASGMPVDADAEYEGDDDDEDGDGDGQPQDAPGSDGGHKNDAPRPKDDEGIPQQRLGVKDGIDHSKGDKGEAKTDANPKQSALAGDGTGDHDPTTQALQDALEEAKAEVTSDANVQGDIKAVNEALWSADTGSQLESYPLVPSTNEGDVARGVAMARGMVQAFEEVNTETQPTWQEQQTRGVLNVARYITHKPGDREYFRSWAEEQAPGHNIAVSVLLDYSGSMGSSCGALSSTAYAMKAACDELGIPCTVLLWDTDAVVLWDGLDKADFVPVIRSAGGTNPETALTDITTHRYDKDMHIVLVMTDGQFGGRDNWLDEYRHEGTYFIGAVYGGGKNDEASMARLGFDRYMSMDNLDPLVALLEEAVIDLSEVQ